MGMPIEAEQQLGWHAGAHDCEHGEAQLEGWVLFGLDLAEGRTRNCGAAIIPPADWGACACGGY